MQKKKILICGATGFMGRNIYEYFLKLNDFEIYGTSFKRTIEEWKGKKLFKADLTTKEGINEVFNFTNYDIVIQAAATTSGSKDIIERPYLHVKDNAIMNSLILQACYDYKVEHFLFLSCGVMYNPERTPVTEKDFFLDEEIHKNYFGVGWTKVYIEKMCEFYSRLGRTKHTAIRHSNTYGPYDKYDLEKSHMFGATITKIMTAQDGDEIIVWGDGLTERDLLYVDDVVDFIHKAITNQKNSYELYNVGYGKSFSVKEIVQKIINFSGKKLLVKHDLTKPSINTKLTLVSDKALQELNWKPKTQIDDGIFKTIQWYKNNIKSEK
jgi:GDP-L-fucose synthase